MEPKTNDDWDGGLWFRKDGPNEPMSRGAVIAWLTMACLLFATSAALIVVGS